MTVDASPARIGIFQIAWSVLDQNRSQSWYAEVLGFLPTGEIDPSSVDEAPDIGALQGVPGAELTMSWVVDQQDFFQFEFFQYKKPEVRRRPADWRPCDIGYTMIGVHVVDFDAALARLAEHRVATLTAPLETDAGRRVCLSDPDGVIIELMEDDPRTPSPRPRPRPGLPVVTRSVTASVPDLDASLRYFAEAAGMHRVDDFTLHGPEHEALWGMAGARRRSQLLWAGDFWVELVEYTDPVGKPWPPGHRISDQGLLNIALGTRDTDLWHQTHDRLLEAGFQGNQSIDLGWVQEDYMMDDQGFSLEISCLDESLDVEMGFKPADDA